MRTRLRAGLTFLVLTLVICTAPFAAAGTLDWLAAWLYLLLLTGATLATRLVVVRRHPDLVAERAGYASVPNVEPGDRTLVFIVGLAGPLLLLLVAGLDHRFGWTPALAAPVAYLAGACIAAGAAFAGWAMVSNPFFSAVARIQDDRGQHVISDGPYRVVRHPGYAGSLLATLAAPFMLGTFAALVPAALTAGAIALRTAREDRMLHRGLPGYDAYARRTRYRLIPGAW